MKITQALLDELTEQAIVLVKATDEQELGNSPESKNGDRERRGGRK